MPDSLIDYSSMKAQKEYYEIKVSEMREAANRRAARKLWWAKHKLKFIEWPAMAFVVVFLFCATCFVIFKFGSAINALLTR